MTERKKEYDAEYRAKHKDMLNRKKRMWYKENRERVLAEQKQYRIRKRECSVVAAVSNKSCKTCLWWYDKKCWAVSYGKHDRSEELAELYKCGKHIEIKKEEANGTVC